MTGDDSQDRDESQEDGLSNLASGPVALHYSKLRRHLRCLFRTSVTVGALNTPSLWTKINVSPLESVPFDHVKTLLERSKSLSVEIHIDCKPLANVKEGR